MGRVFCEKIVNAVIKKTSLDDMLKICKNTDYRRLIDEKTCSDIVVRYGHSSTSRSGDILLIKMSARKMNQTLTDITMTLSAEGVAAPVPVSDMVIYILYNSHLYGPFSSQSTEPIFKITSVNFTSMIEEKPATIILGDQSSRFSIPYPEVETPVTIFILPGGYAPTIIKTTVSEAGDIYP